VLLLLIFEEPFALAEIVTASVLEDGEEYCYCYHVNLVSIDFNVKVFDYYVSVEREF
jgi:hypothetical protein